MTEKGNTKNILFQQQALERRLGHTAPLSLLGFKETLDKSHSIAVAPPIPPHPAPTLSFFFLWAGLLLPFPLAKSLYNSVILVTLVSWPLEPAASWLAASLLLSFPRDPLMVPFSLSALFSLESSLCLLCPCHHNINCLYTLGVVSASFYFVLFCFSVFWC